MSDSKDQYESISARLERLEQSLNERRTKDFWDKLSAVSTLFSGIVIAGLGLYATAVYNERQLEATSAQKDRELAVLELQTVATFFDHLSSGDPGLQKSSLEMIVSLADVELAAKLAANLGGNGGEEFLRELALGSTGSTSAKATKLLNDVEQTRVKKLDLELSHRFRFFRDLIYDGEINDKIMSEVQNILEQASPSEQDYMIGGSIYLFEEYAGNNLITIFNTLKNTAPEERSTSIREAIDAVKRFQIMILSAPTREVSLAENIIGSVPAFSDDQIEQIRDLIEKLHFWMFETDSDYAES